MLTYRKDKMIMRARKSSKNKITLLVVGSVFVLLLIILALEKAHIINLYASKHVPITNNDAQTTSTAPTAQDNFTDGDDRQPASTSRNEGVVADTGGNIQSTPTQNQWTSSKDGNITVYSPAKDSKVISGDSVSGASKLTSISFRLIDDVKGVIAQGSLSVVDGKFSGKFNFSTTGTNGRLDIFSVSDDGVESSNIELPVRFR